LERIILDMDLYKAERSREVMENVVQTMRDNVTTSASPTNAPRRAAGPDP
jgi:hypothetical protein